MSATGLDITLAHNGVAYQAQIASVGYTTLGTEDHGIFTAEIGFTWPGGGQGIPARGLASEKWPDSNGYGIEHLWSIIRTVGCGSWEELKGSSCLILRTSYFGLIEGIADLNAERVLIFAEHHDAWEAAHPRTAAELAP